MNLTRREILKLGLTGSGMMLAPFVLPENGWAATMLQCSPSCDREPATSSALQPGRQELRFQQPLYIPEVLQPSLRQNFPRKTFSQRDIDQTCSTGGNRSVCATVAVEQSFDYYEITMRKQMLEIVPARDGKPPIQAEFWVYQGSGAKPTKPWVTGPLIRQQKNRASCIRFINELGEEIDSHGKTIPICTSVHLHGMASLPQYDGYSEDLTPSGYYKDYYYPNNRASILWYHDHAVHKTSRNVYMGLAGMYIVEYDKHDFYCPQDFGCLPKGEFEIPLIIQDKTFEATPNHANQWQLVFSDRQQRGVYADLVMVNGVPFPYLKVKRQKYYFRVLNGSVSRTYQLALSGTPDGLTNGSDLTKDGQPMQMTVIGSDAGLLAEPAHLIATQQPLRIGVAERYGVIIDFAKFRPDVKQIYLRNLVFSGNLGTHAEALVRFDLEDGAVTDASYIPEKLGKLTLKTAMEQRQTQTRTFRFGRGGQWMIDGKTWSPARVDANPKQCAIEVWNLVNSGGWTHPVHIHLVDFQILDRNGREPLPYEKGWKDVVLLKDNERVRVVARFGPHRGKYMMHCHNIVHEDHDMMTQFEVGQGAPDPCCDPAQKLPPPPLGSKEPPLLLEECLPCQCFEELPIATNGACS